MWEKAQWVCADVKTATQKALFLATPWIKRWIKAKPHYVQTQGPREILLNWKQISFVKGLKVTGTAPKIGVPNCFFVNGARDIAHMLLPLCEGTKRK